MSWFTTGVGLVVDIPQIVVPSSGDTITPNSNTNVLFLDHAGLIALLTINFPSSPVNMQRFTIATGQGVTLLTMQNGTIRGALSTMTVNGFCRYIYNSGIWWRVG